MLTKCWLEGDQKAAFALPSFSVNATSVSAHLSPWLVSNGYNCATVKSNELYIQDVDVAVCLMNQALDFLQKALGNTVAQYILAKNGLETWARVTNYYASYFSVHSLLCLQGRTITRLHLDNALQVHLVAVDLRNHVFGVTTRIGRNPHHAAPWKRYYDIYDRYAVPHDAYELVVRKAHVADPADESIERNEINYTPFKGFDEIRDLRRYSDFSDLFIAYVSNLERKSTKDEFLTELKGFASDPDHKYFARTLLKLALIGDILLSIRRVNIVLEAEWVAISAKWEELLARMFSDSTSGACYLRRFVPLIGSS